MIGLHTHCDRPSDSRGRGGRYIITLMKFFSGGVRKMCTTWLRGNTSTARCQRRICWRVSELVLRKKIMILFLAGRAGMIHLARYFHLRGVPPGQHYSTRTPSKGSQQQNIWKLIATALSNPSLSMIFVEFKLSVLKPVFFR